MLNLSHISIYMNILLHTRLMCSRLEASVLRVINPHFSTIKDSNVKQNLIRAVELIGKAVQPKHVQRDDFVFARRADLLKHMKVIIFYWGLPILNANMCFWSVSSHVNIFLNILRDFCYAILTSLVKFFFYHQLCRKTCQNTL